MDDTHHRELMHMCVKEREKARDKRERHRMTEHTLHLRIFPHQCNDLIFSSVCDGETKTFAPYGVR